MDKVCIVGMGYVGMTLAMHAARNGYEVHGIEIHEETYNLIKSGKTHFHEPGLDELLQTSLNKKFFIYSDVPDDQSFDVVIITVGTPLDGENIKSPNINILNNAIESIKHIINKDNLLILRSTIPVGLTRETSEIIGKLNNINPHVSFCPERTAEGRALSELRSLPQIISGINEESKAKAKIFFEPLVDEIIESSSLEEAELIKLFNNTYRDSIFAISNTFNKIAQFYGVDGSSVINNANLNYPRSMIPKPGFVAGPCLEKDAYILSSRMNDDYLKDFIIKIRNANENLEVTFAEVLSNILSSDSSLNVLISGIAFKGVPQTNDLRGSSSVRILDQLKNFNDQITIHDFMNTKETLEKSTGYKSIKPEDFNLSNKEKFDLIVVLNNHPFYKNTSSKNFVNYQIDIGAKVIDVWDVMELVDHKTISNVFIDSK